MIRPVSGVSLNQKSNSVTQSSKRSLALGNRQVCHWSPMKVLKVATLGLLLLATPYAAATASSQKLSKVVLPHQDGSNELELFNKKSTECERHFNECFPKSPMDQERQNAECLWRDDQFEFLCGWERSMRPEQTKFFGYENAHIDYAIKILTLRNSEGGVRRIILSDKNPTFMSEYLEGELNFIALMADDKIRMICPKDSGYECVKLDENENVILPLKMRFTILLAEVLPYINAVLAGLAIYKCFTLCRRPQEPIQGQGPGAAPEGGR